MNIKEKIEDLILQATTDKSHYYTKGVLKEVLAYIELLEAGKVDCPDCFSKLETMHQAMYVLSDGITKK